MNHQERPPRIKVTCLLNENEFVPESILDEEPTLPEKKTVSHKLLDILEFFVKKIEKALIGGFQEELTPPVQPNQLLGADNLCRKTFQSLGLQHSEYSRREKRTRIHIPEKNIDKDLLVDVGFDIFIPHNGPGDSQEVISEIKTALLREPILAELFDITVTEEVKK